jgi:hypothetical protein
MPLALSPSSLPKDDTHFLPDRPTHKGLFFDNVVPELADKLVSTNSSQLYLSRPPLVISLS